MPASLTCLLISDTHGEFEHDGGVNMAKTLPNEGVDVLLACGDITTLQHLRYVAEVLCERFPHVLWVTGNHEFYGAGRKYVEEELTRLSEWWGFDWLHRDVVDINGFTFAGTTAWYGPHEENPTKDDIQTVNQGSSSRIIDRLIRTQWGQSGRPPTNRIGTMKAAEKRRLRDRIEAIHRRSINDFFKIPGLLDWVYEEHKQDQQWLFEVAPAVDVVLTHLAPSSLSIPDRFSADPRKRYYFHPWEGFLTARGPQWWLHGHTHDEFDYTLGNTRVVCHPRGYPRERGDRPYQGFRFKVAR